MSDQSKYMALALLEAEAAAQRGEVPVGCVIVDRATQDILATSGNRTEELSDPSAHAEILALRAAGEKAGSPRLVNADLYVTLEPCAMCAAAISFGRVKRLFFGAYDPKMGGVDHGVHFFESISCHHKPEVVGGLRETESAVLLKQFFEDRRS